jgi:hypothetical protein
MSTQLVLKDYLLCYLDFIGQSDKLELLSCTEDAGNKDEKYVNDAICTYKLIATAQDIFERTFGYLKLEGVRESRERMHFQSISDSLLIYVPLSSSTDSLESLSAIALLLSAVGIVFLLYLAHGFLLRGAVEIGIGTEIPKVGFYGSALLRAYRLEQKADYPRMLVGGDLMRYLHSPFDQKGGSEAEALANFCLGLIKQDFDGKDIIDYLKNPCTQKYQLVRRDMIALARQYIQTMNDEFSQLSLPEHDKLFLRSYKLAKYFKTID